MRPPRFAWALVVLGITVAAARAAAPWQPLLDLQLAQWDTYLSFRHEPTFNGQPPRDAAGQLVAPVGYNRDTTHVFSVEERDGSLVLHVSGEIYGCLFTKQEFSNYRLRLQVKWGEKKFPPRTDKLRDSGVLYHSIGPAGVDYWRSWMLAQEFQIMEGHMGDHWPIASAAIDIRAYLPEGEMNAVAGERPPFLAFGEKKTDPAFCLRSENAETPAPGWTQLELVCFEDKSVRLVNGRVVMVCRNSRYVKPDGEVAPLTRGRIQLQSEAAEVFYRAIEIHPIDALPAEFEALYR